jgi:hypothetical protein
MSFDEASFIGFAAAVVVVFADSLFVVNLWTRNRKPGSGGEETFSDAENNRSSSVTTTIRGGLWGTLGLFGVGVGAAAFNSASNFGNAIRTWPDQLTLSAVVIAMALILSAIILASVYILTARLNAVGAVSHDADEARRHLILADRHLAVIAKYRRVSERPG